MRNKLLIAIGSLFLGSVSYGQMMTMSDPDYVGANQLDCSALGAGGVNFIDMTGNYSANFDDTITFCPDLTQGTKVSIAFATNIGYEFDIHPSDTLYIYDGPNTSAPLLAATNSAVNPTGANWQASFENNPSGCLTVRFKTDGANDGTGWIAKVACGNLAQPYYPHLEAYVNGNPQNVLNPIDTGYVNVCLGDSILFVAKPLFPYSLESTGYGYSQNLDNINYNWTISNVGPLGISNDSVWFVPTARQGYFVDLKMTDQFPQLKGITAKVRVSILPSFATAGPLEDTICIGTPTDLIGGVTAQDTAGVEVPGGEFTIGGSFAGLTFLPDGNGQLYETTINISGLGSGTVTQPSDISSICLDIEHSFIGDLEITLTCPNGTMVSLMNTYNGFGGGELVPNGCSGGGISLGSDTDTDGGAPGSPVETYCFSFVNPDFGTICANLGNTYSNPSGNTAMIPGTYTPDGDFNDFIGCPLDGNWTISVQDNQGIDDGYIFQWGIVFDASLYPNFETYQNYYVDGFWSPSPNIVSGQNDTLVVVQTTAPGHSYYTYNVVDDFGCAYDTTFDIFSLPLPIIFPDTIACDMTYQVTGTQAYAGGVWSATPAGLNFSSTTNNNPLITTNTAGTYTVSYIDNACSDTVTSTIIFPPYPQIFNDTLLCGDQFNVTGTLVYPTGGHWSAVSPEVIFLPEDTTTNPIITATTSGTYTVTFTDNVCNNSTSAQVTLFLLPDIFPDTSTCNFIYNVSGTVAANGGVWSSADTNIHFMPSANVLNPVITSSIPGTFQVTFTDNQCNTSVTSDIEFINYAYVNTVDTVICIGSTIVTSCGVYPQNDTYVWSDGTVGHDITVGPGVYTVTASNECNSHSSTMTIGGKVCYITAPNIIVLSSTVGNNKFYLDYDGVDKFEISIVNRWGNLITEYSDPGAAWDGRNMNGEVVSEGVYFYKFKARLLTGEEVEQQGFVQVFH
ncbi:proprotein convertase P-domain-containing protein [Fluviicola sp.]|uniref:proprotein convertase P-domain-containing protein n=1 Tax=Fluviicola sp. TaxID=1917219 RepID=UPI0031DFB22C